MNLSNKLFIALLLAVLSVGIGFGWWLNSRAAFPAAEAADMAQPASEPEVLYYRHPMNPEIHSDRPAKDDMGMDYIPMYADKDATSNPDANADAIRIDSHTIQNLGVRVGVAERRSFSRAVDAAGTVVIDERGVTSLSPRISGWIERLHVKAVGDVVERGQALAEIYSPELLNAQEEYRVALQASQRFSELDNVHAQTDAAALVAAARDRLRLLNVANQDIVALEKGGIARRTLTIRAPHRGVVTELLVREGSFVSPEMKWYSLADLSKVWVNAQINASQLAWVKQGDPVSLTSAFLPKQQWLGHIDYLYPTVNSETRTVEARLVFDNPKGLLRPGMYASVRIDTAAQESVLAVPREAVMRTGKQEMVMLALGEGRFRPAQVRTGVENDSHIEITEGLREGESIVLSGQFLLDAEASFQGATARLEGSIEAQSMESM